MRFIYVVRPVLGQWEVSFGEQGSRFLYGGREEAVQVARGAAKLHWETHHRPSGVRVDTPDGSVEIASYGSMGSRRATPSP